MDVTWSNGEPEGNPDGAELDLAVGGVLLRWWSGNDWAVPTADIPDVMWPQLALAPGLSLGGKPLPATKPVD